MKAFRSVGLVVLLAAGLGAVAGNGIDSAEFKSPTARSAIETYAGAQAKLTKEYKEKGDVARKACIAQLSTAQQAATKAGNLDEAIQIRDAIAKLTAEVQEQPAGTSHSGGGERQRLTSSLANTIWQGAEGKFRFNDDGTGAYMEGSKPDASKPLWTWAALTGHEVIVRYSSGWTNRMEFDDTLKNFAIHDSANGKKLDLPGGKRLQ